MTSRPARWIVGVAFVVGALAACGRVADEPARTPDDDAGGGARGDAAALPPPSPADAASRDAERTWTEVPIDGGFEDVPDGASGCGSGWSSGSLSSTAHGGQAACRACGGAFSGRFVRTWSPGEIGAGDYRAAFWYRGESGSGPSGLVAEATATDGQLSTRLASLGGGPAPTWVRLELAFTVPEGLSLSTIALGWESDGAYCLLVDDVTLERANPAAAP